MRPLIIPFVIVAAFPQMQKVPLTLTPAISVMTTRPRVDVGTTFKLAGSAATVTWDFGEGKGTQVGGSTINHTYRQAGTFTVKATVGTVTAQQTITVVEPRRITTKPATPAPGKPTSLKLEDPFGTALLWNFGDGSAPVNGGASISHTFPNAGDYPVTVRDHGIEPAPPFQLSVAMARLGP